MVAALKLSKMEQHRAFEKNQKRWNFESNVSVMEKGHNLIRERRQGSNTKNSLSTDEFCIVDRNSESWQKMYIYSYILSKSAYIFSFTNVVCTAVEATFVHEKLLVDLDNVICSLELLSTTFKRTHCSFGICVHWVRKAVK